VDTILFALIFAVLAAMTTGRRWLVIALFLLTLAATLAGFRWHVTEALPLNF
jgi:hypothetical protein